MDKRPSDIKDLHGFIQSRKLKGKNVKEIRNDLMVLYSLTYSYKNHTQALGRIDRLDSPYDRVYYYHLCSDALIDRRIKEALDGKRDFQERNWT